jgi:spore germination cell wall hydrolase CwlJ-like protein
MTPLDQISLALCIWKENRGGGIPGMQSCANVIMNRAALHKLSVYAVIYQPLQFSSMSYQHDPELLIQPKVDDLQWIQAQQLAERAAAGNLEDITLGATNYYAVSIPEPSWAAAMTPTVMIAGQRFFK